MQYLNTIFALTTSAALVAGNPTGPVKWTGGSKEGMTGHQAAQQCGSQQSVACCQNSSGGLLGGLLNGVLGGDCGLVNLNLLLSQTCGGNDQTVVCCDNDNNGASLIDLSCSPIDIL